jgi:hypothetical protein
LCYQETPCLALLDYFQGQFLLYNICFIFLNLLYPTCCTPKLKASAYQGSKHLTQRRHLLGPAVCAVWNATETLLREEAKVMGKVMVTSSTQEEGRFSDSLFPLTLHRPQRRAEC